MLRHAAKRYVDFNNKSRILTLTHYGATILISGFIALCSLEIMAQSYFYLVIQPNFEKQRASERHYYRKSENPILAYELAPGYVFEGSGQSLSINAHGMRGEQVGKKQFVRLGLLGDSVAFSTGHGDDHTISALVQKRLEKTCKEIEVLNVGVPGYAIREIHENFLLKSTSNSINAIIYILNLNDFSWRDTVYEGADNGLYRMYNPPRFKTPWFVRKMIYRWIKYGTLSTTSRPSSRWYRWMFEGTQDETLDQIRKMKAFARENEIAFSVFMLPAGVAYEDGAYTLSDIHSNVSIALRSWDIVVVDGKKVFAEKSADFFDETDHLTYEGNQAVANVLSQLFLSEFSTIARQAACRI